MAEDEAGRADRIDAAAAVPTATDAARRGAASADEHLEKTQRHFVLALVALFAVLSFLVFRPFISYVFMGLLLAYLTRPLYRRTLRAVKRPAVAAGIVLVVSALAVVAPLVWVGVEVASTVRGFLAAPGGAEALVGAIDRVATTVAGALGLPPPEEGFGREAIRAATEGATRWAQAHLGDVVAIAGAVVVGLIVMLFVLYYALKEGDRLVAFFAELSPLDDALDHELVGEVRKTVDAVFLGHIIVSAIQGLLGGIGFLIFGVPNAVFWGFVMIILALIPLLGAPIVWLPAGVWLLSVGHTWQGVGLLLWGALLVSTIDNVLRPKIVGSRADIHPIMVLIGVLGGIGAFGFIGFVLGPLVLAMLFAILNFWRRDFLPAYEAKHAANPHVAEPATPIEPDQ